MRNILLFFCLFTFSQLRADDYLLKGTIGKYPIVVNLYIRGAEAEVTYFYTSSCIDIVLKGTAGDNGIVVYGSRYKADKDDTTETMQLHENANKQWTGNWSNNKGRKYDVVLTPVDIKTVKNPFDNLPMVKDFKKNDDYNYMRSAMLTVAKDTGTAQYGKYSLQYYHLKNSDVGMFDIVGGLDKAVADKVNAILKNKFIEHAWNYCGCSGADTPDYNYTLNPPYITNNILSISINAEFYCNQAAHPDHVEDPLTIDLKTGKKLSLPDLLYLTPVPMPDPESDKYSDYMGDVYAPKLVALLKKMYPRYMVASEDCDYSQIEPWRYARWYVTGKGLYLSPSFSHAQSPCEYTEWSYIPFDVLKKYKNPKKQITLP